MTQPLLDLRFESCVRSLSVWTSCTKCVEACPEQAISDDGAYQSIIVDLDACTDCGLCAAACPTDAFTAPYDVEAFVDTTGPRIVCGDGGLPCIGALATEDLIAVVLRVGDVTLVDRPCAHGSAHATVAGRVAEARTFLHAAGLPGSVTVVVEPEPAASGPDASASLSGETGRETVLTDRRRWLLGGGKPSSEPRPSRGSLKQPDRLDKDALQYTQDRRWRLLSRLPADLTPSAPTVPGAALSFTSSKTFQAENCTLCTICVRICPTGALTSGRSFRDLKLDTSQCVRCGLCHEVCQTDAIHLAETTSIVDFLDRAPTVLGRVKSRKCGECGMSYNAAVNVHGMCPRCESLEQEAIELSMVKR